ncbi:MAG: hypothetical protein NWR72_15720 [Bacteroidia bacterium]|nr:hypothetical protein [Bacteroidia bacterium]
MNLLSRYKWVLGLVGLAAIGLAIAFSLPKKKGGGDCGCTPLTAAEAVEQADLIIKGTLTYSTTNWMSGGMKYSFQVDEAWKRRCDALVVVNSGWEQDCGVSFKEGETYLIFINKKFSFQTNRCSGTALISEATATLGLLAEMEQAPIVSSPVVVKMYWTIGILGLASILFIAFVVLRKQFIKS